MSDKLYTTFGNELKYRYTQDTLEAYLENATIRFPLPEASADILGELAPIENVNPQELDLIKTKLVSIGFAEPKAVTMASVLIQVARSQNISPFEYFSSNEASLKLAIDSYTAINLLRPSGNRISITTPIKNNKSRYNQIIKP